MDDRFDLIVVGGGTAGLAAAIEACDGGLRVLVVEKDSRIGGTLHTTGGHVAGAGTRRQIQRGIQDSPEVWLKDIARITPLHILGVGLVAGLLFVIALMVIVNLIVTKS